MTYKEWRKSYGAVAEMWKKKGIKKDEWRNKKRSRFRRLPIKT